MAMMTTTTSRLFLLVVLLWQQLFMTTLASTTTTTGATDNHSVRRRAQLSSSSSLDAVSSSINNDIIGSSTTTADLYRRYLDQQVGDDGIGDDNVDDDDSWPVGTKVYYEFDDGWYEGTITAFDDDGYTITWEDNTIDYDDFTDAQIDQMVENYQTMVANGGDGDVGTADDDDSWPVGTKVYYEFDDGWYEGTITAYDDNGYTITWEDNSIDYDDFTDAQVDQMVENYQTMVVNGGGDDGTAGDDDSWPVGTKVYYEFDDGWYEGTITDYDDNGYTITWEDNTIDYDDFSDEEVDQMVENYQTMIANANDDGVGDDGTADDDSWPIGTKVYWEFEDDGWYEGTITDYDDDGYTITWSDGSIDYDDFTDDQVDEMVANYQTMIANAPPPSATDDNNNSGGNKMKPGGVFVIVAVVIFALVGVGYLFARRRRFAKEDEIQELSLNHHHRNGTREIS